VPDWSIVGYSTIRTLHFSFQQKALNFFIRALPGHRDLIGVPDRSKEKLDTFRKNIQELYRQDTKNIREDYYPLSVLTPERPLAHALRLPKLFIDGLRIHLRKQKNKTKNFGPEAKKYLDDLPDYYKRNYHFQTDGYLSERSAELYEHQVETLFSGTADAMRRIFIRPLKDALKERSHSKLKILELAVGTGRTTRFLSLAFPNAKITATDLSYPYLKFAQKSLSDLDGISFLQADATRLPLNDAEYDVVVVVFLFHELPPEERRMALKEAHRVLKPGGHFAFVDSLQKNDWEPANESLEQFPVDFHEPFYKNYVENPMELELAKAGFESIETNFGFVSKACIASKPQK
jgi:ubiquinone/menaquinone biosynthesis C-methylase UbiE